jgi:hypothetical protein
MRRASLERQRTLREWRKRLLVDETLEPGRFRKGRSARGCPKRCVHCRIRKQSPTIQEQRGLLNFADWLQAEYPKMHKRHLANVMKRRRETD